MVGVSCVLATFTFYILFQNTIAKPPPNIIFILSDDIGYHDISYHSTQVLTPLLDLMAKSGVVLEQYYTQPVGVGARASLLTGRYPIHLGFQNVTSLHPSWKMGLPLEFTLLPDVLKKHGYRTHIVGKWHLGHYKRTYLPTSRGFDSHFGYYTTAIDYFQHTWWDVNNIPPPSWTLDLHNSSGNSTECVPEHNGTYSIELFGAEAVRIIDAHNTEDPLFLYLPFQSVHQPNQVPNAYRRYFSQVETLDRQILLSIMSALDATIYKVYNALLGKGNAFWQNTLIVFTSDNGGWPIPGSTGSNYPLRGGKYTLFEGGIRVPAFVFSPLITNPRRVERNLIHVTDWYPTLLMLAGARDSEYNSLDGFNQWRLLSEGVHGGNTAQRVEILHNIEVSERGVVTSAFRYGSWKILTGKWAKCTIYSDPHYCSWIPPPSIAEYYYSDLKESTFSDDPFEEDDIDFQSRTSNRTYSPLLLFHINSDPKELWDRSSVYPNIVNLLLNRLDNYFDSMISPVGIHTSEKWKPVAMQQQCIVPWDD